MLRRFPVSQWESGFTLIELLVVITIIVVLLALLTPALEKAVYQAELAVCGAHQRGIGTSVSGYAFDNKRHYPYRPAVREPIISGSNSNAMGVWRVNALKGDGQAIKNPWDDRPLFKTFMSIDLLNCPLSGKIDLDGGNTYDREDAVFASYQMWFGWGYNQGTAAAHKGMMRMGDRFHYGNDRFDLLASDRDEYDTSSSSYADTSHPDAEGVLANVISRDTSYPGATANTTFHVSAWQKYGSFQRGTIDMNFLYQDLSVIRADRLAYDDKELVAVPLYTRTGTDFPARGVRLLKPSN